MEKYKLGVADLRSTSPLSHPLGFGARAREHGSADAEGVLVLELEPENTAVLMQRACLYEAMEKYKLGVADLRLLSRLDPSNRAVATSLNRLNKALAALG
ncbi:unnamed protein product [Closterium sp. NIES-53]